MDDEELVERVASAMKPRLFSPCLTQESIDAPGMKITRNQIRHLARIAIRETLLTATRASDGMLGDPQDWAGKREELLTWTGSAFLAGETHPSDNEAKRGLYAFLCGLIGWLATGEEAARAALSSQPAKPVADDLASALDAVGRALFAMPGKHSPKYRRLIAAFQRAECLAAAIQEDTAQSLKDEER